MRANLKKARTRAGFTQQMMADRLGITLNGYQKLESGERTGSVDLWDALEDIFNVHQRVLRENHPGQEDNL